MRATRSSRRLRVVPAAPAPLASIASAGRQRLDQRPGVAARSRCGDADRSQGRHGTVRLREAMKESRRSLSRRSSPSPHGESRSPGRRAMFRPRARCCSALRRAKAGWPPTPGPRFLRRQGRQDHAGQCAASASADRADAERASAGDGRGLCAGSSSRRSVEELEGQAQRRRDPGDQDAAVKQRLRLSERLTARMFVAYTFPVRSYTGSDRRCSPPSSVNCCSSSTTA